MAEERIVLVTVGELARPVVFTDGQNDDVTEVKKAALRVFNDVLKVGDRITLQLKNDEWDGVFVDALDGHIPNRSAIKAIATTPVNSMLTFLVQ